MSQLYHVRFGAGEDRLVMDGGKEDVPGPVIFLLPEKPLRFDVSGIHHVTQRGENLSERILFIPTDTPRAIWWTDQHGGMYCLRLWHYKLKVPW